MNKITVYITKYFKRGVLIASTDENYYHFNGMLPTQWYRRYEYELTEEAAIKEVENARKAEISKLERRIEALKRPIKVKDVR